MTQARTNVNAELERKSKLVSGSHLDPPNCCVIPAEGGQILQANRVSFWKQLTVSRLQLTGDKSPFSYKVSTA